MDYAGLIANMTLEEKCSLLSGGSQFTTKAIPRLGIPSIRFADGPSGVRKQAGSEDHLGLSPSVPATCWPSASTLANAWDPELCREVGRRMGAEAAALRVNVLLGPGLNIQRSPLCGRNFEYYSEDPYLSGKLAAAAIQGIQSQGVAACPKHFAVNSQETLRMHSDSVLDERTLHEIYLTAFEIAVREGHPHSIMSSYNRVNGVYAGENKKLLRDILVDQWGFDGFVVTDWGGSNDRTAAVAAGAHLEMPQTGGSSDREAAAAVRAGELGEEAVDRLVAEYLRTLEQISIPSGAPDGFDQEAHHAFARKAAEASVVLLKNEAEFLPLAVGTRVAVIGDFADLPRFQGAGSSCVEPTRLDRPLEALKAAGLELVGYAPGFLRHGGEAPALLSAAAALAERADVVLLYLGLDELAESEGLDREDMALRENQTALLQAVSAVNPNVAVALSAGAPVECPWLDQCRALVYGGLGGQAGAGAVAGVLTGRVNPSGKLAQTWPLRCSDTPAFRYFPGRERTAEYREGLYVGYRYYATAGVEVRFPFGYGLSYTDFTYGDLEVSPSEASFTVTNTGPLAGAETAQVYVSRRDGDVFRPALELKGFQKVFLAPGESRRVTVPLDDKAFRYFNAAAGHWETEPGGCRVLVGASSRDIRLEGSVCSPGSAAPAHDDLSRLPSYATGRVAQVGDEEFAALLGCPIPPAHWDRNAPLELNDTFAQLVYAKGWVGRLTYRMLKDQVDRAKARGKPDLNALFRLNMPFRGMAKMMGGAVDMAMAAALVRIFNGQSFRGLADLAAAFFRKERARQKSPKC